MGAEVPREPLPKSAQGRANVGIAAALEAESSPPAYGNRDSGG